MAIVTSSRERMLEAAIDVIETAGEAGVRVDVVADAAGVTKPSLYHFFKNRDGLIIAAQAERYRRSLLYSLPSVSEMVRACRSRDEFVMLLGNLIRSFGLEDGKRRRRVRIQVLGSATSRPTLRAEIEAVEREAARQFESVFAIAQERGWIKGGLNLEVVARWWFGIMLSRYLIDEVFDEVQSDQWTDLTLDALEAVIFEPSANRPVY